MIDISTGTKKVLATKKTVYPQHINRISALDDPCLRRLYYMRKAWDKKTLPSDNLQGIFETGKELEPTIERIAIEVGLASEPPWRIVGKQVTTNDKLLNEYQISGTIDGLLQVKKNDEWQTVGVVDTKTMSPNVYPRLNTYFDLARYGWTRGYRGQLMLYALAHNLENCFILAVNKSNLYDMKFIEFPVDMEYCDKLLSKAKEINEAIEYDIIPEKINDPNVCPNCAWNSYCCPDFVTGKDFDISTNEDLESALNTIEELQPIADEYNSYCKIRDSFLIKGRNTVCGKWLILWKQTSDGKWRKSITNNQ